MEHTLLVEVLRSVANEDDLAYLHESIAGMEPVAAGLILQIARQLEEGRRREALLRVLGDIAVDLTALRDTQAVLKAIAVRTRQLLGTDMAYVSLNNLDTQETFIQESDGVRTHEYRTIRMPLGTGILGKAATGRELVATSRYGVDEDIVHLPDIDRIVAAEGVEAIMGVPLVSHDEVLGALMVAMRAPKRFTEAERDTVRMIARHAAVAVDNAQRFAEAASSLRSLDSTLQVEQDALARARTLMEVDEQLLEVVVRRPRHADLLSLAHRMLAAEVALVDEDGRVVAGTVGAENPTVVPGHCPWLPTGRDVEQRVTSAVTTGHALTVSGAGGEITVAPALASGQHVATVVARGALGPVQRWSLERVAVFAAMVSLTVRASEAADERLHAEVLDDLLLQRFHDPDRLRASLRRFGLHPADPVWLLVVADTGPQVGRALRAAMADRAGIVATHDGHWCLVVNEAGAAEHVAGAIEDTGAPVRIGTAGPADDLRAVAAAHTRAHMALTSLEGLQRDGIADGNQLGAVAAVLAAGPSHEALLEPLAPLRRHDERHGTELLRTAWTFLEADRSVADTARALYIHRNTVRQRVARIGGLLGGDWDASPRRLETHLALWIWRLGDATHRAEVAPSGRDPRRRRG